MLDDAHVVLETDDRGVALQSGQQNILVVIEKVTTQDDRLRL